MAEVLSLVKDMNGIMKKDTSVITPSTRTGQSNMVIDAITPDPGPFDPGKTATVATDMRFKNTGTGSAQKINIKLGEYKNGSWNSVCTSSTDVAIDPGNCAGWLGYNPRDGCLQATNMDCTTTTGGIHWSMPDEWGVTVNLAIKVWGTDESEPGWPSPGAATVGTRADTTPEPSPSPSPKPSFLECLFPRIVNGAVFIRSETLTPRMKCFGK